MAAALLLLLAAAHLLPEHLPALLGGTHAAWDYVVSSAEKASLWACGFALAPLLSQRFMFHVKHPKTAIRLVCVWGFVENAQRAACRPVFPMDRPPPRPPPGDNLCDLATGLPFSLLSLVAALTLVVALTVLRK